MDFSVEWTLTCPRRPRPLGLHWQHIMRSRHNASPVTSITNGVDHCSWNRAACDGGIVHASPDQSPAAVQQKRRRQNKPRQSHRFCKVMGGDGKFVTLSGGRNSRVL